MRGAEFGLQNVDWRQPLSSHGLNSGLVAFYLAGSPGFKSSYWIELSGYDNRGTLTNMDPATDWTGIGAACAPVGLSFDGSNDHVAIADNPSLNFGSGDFTLSVHFRVDGSGVDINNRRTLISSGGGANRYLMRVTGSGGGDTTAGLLKGEVDDNTTRQEVESTLSVDDGAFHTGVFCRHGTDINVLVDGRDQQTTSIGSYGSTDTAGSKYLGMLTSTLHPFNGIIASALIHNRALPAQESIALHEQLILGFPAMLNRRTTRRVFVPTAAPASVSYLSLLGVG